MNVNKNSFYFQPIDDTTSYTPCLTPPSITSHYDNQHYSHVLSQQGLSRSNSQPDLKLLIENKSSSSSSSPTVPSSILTKVRRHPSFNFSSLSSHQEQDDFYFDLNTPTTTDDGIFLGTDFASDLLSGGDTFSDIFDDLEGLMSCVTFDQFNSNLEDFSTKSTVSCDASQQQTQESRLITRSAPPSPTPMMREKKRASNWALNKPWSKMSPEEKTFVGESLTRLINDEMGLREQLEFIRIIDPYTVKLLPTDTQFILDLNMIDDEKFRRIKELIKFHGLKFNDIINSDNCSECSANSCPQTYKLKQRELRLRRAQQRILKHTQRKESRQIMKESKSGLFIKTEVIPLSTVLPEEDIDVDILG